MGRRADDRRAAPFYAELSGARVRHSGFATSRDLGPAAAWFSPLASVALLDVRGGDPVAVAAFLVLRETRTSPDPSQERIVSPAAVAEEPVMSR